VFKRFQILSVNGGVGSDQGDECNGLLHPLFRLYLCRGSSRQSDI
jgi:hypothetical protein